MTIMIILQPSNTKFKLCPLNMSSQNFTISPHEVNSVGRDNA